MVAVLAMYVGSHVIGPGSGYHAWRDGWLANVALTLPGLLCLASARRTGPVRGVRALLGLGLLCEAAGNTINVCYVQYLAHPPVPSWSDVGYLSFYPFVIVALALSRPRDARGVVALDGALGAAAAAAIVAAILSPVFLGANGHGPAFYTALAYPVSDLVLIAIVAGLLAARGGANASLLWMGAGLLVYVFADVIYALRIRDGSYAVGTPLDCLWAIGMTVMAFSAWTRPKQRSRKRQSLGGALVVPLLSSLVAVSVLVIATQYQVADIAVVLAAVTLLIAVARTAVSLRHELQLSDMRNEQARTDDLTGLPNRRAFHERIGEVLTSVG